MIRLNGSTNRDPRRNIRLIGLATNSGTLTTWKLRRLKLTRFTQACRRRITIFTWFI
jgi:hypothetical protein